MELYEGAYVGYSEADLRMLTDSTDGGSALRDYIRQFSGDSRVRVGGFIQRVLGKHHYMMPAVSASVAEAVEMAAGEARQDLLDELMENHPDREWAKTFLGDRAVLPVPGRDGKFVLEQTIPGVTDISIAEYSPEINEEYTVFTEKRLYSLDQFFSDTDVVEKFPLSEQFLQTVRRCAVMKPGAAADMVQKKLHAFGYTGVRVQAGKYVKSKKRASDTILAATRRLVDRDPGVWSRTIDGKVFYYHDDAEQVLLWTVEGPLRHALEVKGIYDLCLAVGIEEAVQMMCMETTILNICVRDEISGNYVSGLIESHVDLDGIEPTGEVMAPGLTPEQNVMLTGMHDRVLPVVLHDRVVASAVRVTEKYALVCDHVLVESGDVSNVLIAGSNIVQHKVMGNDLWVVSAEGGLRAAWPLRDGHIGEKVVLVYSVGDRLEVTSPVTVSAVDGLDLALSAPPQLRKGMSGAAVVALADMALLGVYRGKVSGRAVVTAFGQEKYGELVDVELSSQVSVNSQADADDVVARYERRGYSAAFRAACNAVVPVYADGKHLGFGMCYAGNLVTPLDPDLHALRLHKATGRAPVFEATQDGRFSAAIDATEAGNVFTQALPAVGMRVVIVGKDAAGAYLSEVRVVHQVGAGARRFYIDSPEYAPELPLVGGMVLSFDNATVIGQFVGKDASGSLGTRGVCVSSFVPARSVSPGAKVKSIEASFSDLFPMLTPIAWEVGGLEKILTSTSASSYVKGRSLLGQGIAKVVIVRELEKSGSPVSTWEACVSRYVGSHNVSRCYGRSGLTAISGSGRVAELRHQAAIVEALIGMAWVHERWQTVVEFCKALGLFPREVIEDTFTPTIATFPLNVGVSEDVVESPISVYASEGRRPSEALLGQTVEFGSSSDGV